MSSRFSLREIALPHPMAARTLYDKLWQAHAVREEEDGSTLLYIDCQLVHEVTSPQAFEGLRLAGREPWRPDSIVAVADHNVPTEPGVIEVADPVSRLQLETLDANCARHGLLEFRMGDPHQGIVHVIGPELGVTLPGMTVVCGDSHTSTHGALATLAFGIGTSQVEHVLATQCLPMRKADAMLARFEGRPPPGVTPKDLALALIGAIGAAGAAGCAIEFAGAAVEALSVEGRMTLCNMAIEAGARSGMVAVDDATLEYVRGRPYAPAGAAWRAAERQWRELRSDPGAAFARAVVLQTAGLAPQVTWGTSPEMVAPVDAAVPEPADDGARAALDYMGLASGTAITDIELDRVFIGSCTNARIEDLRAAAAVVRGRRRAARVRQALVVPGSGRVRAQAEAEGLDRVFKDAGFEWRAPGCSMCLAMNADRLEPGERCAATSNRNFEGRQGRGGRTHLVSPEMAAAAGVAGRFVDIREWRS